MFKRIVVPLDGSIRAEQAIPVAARIARASGGYVVLLRVVSAATEYWPNMVSEPTMRQVAIDTDLKRYHIAAAGRPSSRHDGQEPYPLGSDDDSHDPGVKWRKWYISNEAEALKGARPCSSAFSCH